MASLSMRKILVRGFSIFSQQVAHWSTLNKDFRNDTWGDSTLCKYLPTTYYHWHIIVKYVYNRYLISYQILVVWFRRKKVIYRFLFMTVWKKVLMKKDWNRYTKVLEWTWNWEIWVMTQKLGVTKTYLIIKKGIVIVGIYLILQH